MLLTFLIYFPFRRFPLSALDEEFIRYVNWLNHEILFINVSTESVGVDIRTPFVFLIKILSNSETCIRNAGSFQKIHQLFVTDLFENLLLSRSNQSYLLSC